MNDSLKAFRNALREMRAYRKITDPYEKMYKQETYDINCMIVTMHKVARKKISKEKDISL